MAAPDFFTVEEAAQILRIGRTAAYLAAKRWRETNGAEGLPCVAIRGSLRVPRRPLETMAGGPITVLLDHETTDDDPRTKHRDRTTSKPTRTNRRDTQRPLFTD